MCKKNYGMMLCLLCVVCVVSATLSFAGGNTLLELKFKEDSHRLDRGQSSDAKVTLVEHSTGTAVTITQNAFQGDTPSFLRYRELDVDRLRGKHVRVQALVKTENLEIGVGQTFYGGHLDFEITTESGPPSHPGQIFTTDFDWATKTFDRNIPKDVKSIDLRIGLQGAKGTIYFDDIKVFTIEK